MSILNLPFFVWTLRQWWLLTDSTLPNWWVCVKSLLWHPNRRFLRPGYPGHFPFSALIIDTTTSVSEKQLGEIWLHQSSCWVADATPRCDCKTRTKARTNVQGKTEQCRLTKGQANLTHVQWRPTGGHAALHCGSRCGRTLSGGAPRRNCTGTHASGPFQAISTALRQPQGGAT